jgi:hypothetical protein
LRREPAVPAADDDWIWLAIDERRVEPHPKPPRSAVKIERRAIAHRNAVPTFKLHSDEGANAGSPGRLDIRDLPRSGQIRTFVLGAKRSTVRS